MSISFLFPSSVNYTLFQLFINPRTKPCILNQSHRVLNNNLHNTQQPRVCAAVVLQNELLTYLGYLNLGCTLRGLEVIQKFNNDNR